MDDKLIYSPAQLKNLFDAAPCAVAVYCAADDEQIYTNNAYYSLAGYTAEEYSRIIGRDYSKLFFCEDANAAARNRCEYEESGRILKSEYRIRCGDGEIRWVRLDVSPVIVGEAECTLTFFTDITEQKAHELYVRLISDSMGGSISLFRIKNGKEELIYANDTFYSFIGIDKQSYENDMSRVDLTLVSEKDRLRTAQAIECSLKTGEPQNVEYKLLREQGQPLWLNRRLFAVPQDEAGVYLLASVVTNITEEKNFQRRLEAEHARYQAVIDHVPCGLVMVRLYPDGRSEPVFANNEYLRMTQMSHDEFMRLYGKDTCAGVHPDDLKRVREALQRLINNEGESETFRLRKGSGGWVWVRVSTARTQEADGTVILYNSYLDVSHEYEYQREMQQLINNVPTGLGIYEHSNGNTRQTFLNENFFRMTGYTRERYNSEIGADFMRCVHEEDRQRVLDSIRSLIDGASIDTLDFRLLCADGSYLNIRMGVRVAMRSEGTFTAYCAYEDVTAAVSAAKQLEQANAALQRSYRQELAQRSLLEKESVIILRLNLTRDRVEECRIIDDSFCSYKPGESSGEILNDLLRRISSTEEKEAAKNLFDCRKRLKSYENGEMDRAMEYRSRQKDGRMYWLRATSHMQQLPGSDDIMSYTYIKDIDVEKKRALAVDSVVDEETEFVLLVCTVSDTGMVVWLHKELMRDDKKLYREFPFRNVRLTDEFGTVFDSDKGQLEEIFDKAALMRRLETEAVITITYREKDSNGNIRRKKLRAFYMDDLREDIVIACRDITDLYIEEQEQKHRLKAASDAKTAFLSRVSHDMRTPLNGILGITYLAKDKDDPQELKKDLALIENSGKLLLNLVNDTLDMNRIESGKMQLNPTECDEEALFEAIFTVIEPDLKKKNIALHVEKIGIDWKTMLLDVPRLQQVFVNLFSNAIKFTPEGGDIWWVMECLESRADYVIARFVVRDNGIGMSKEFQRHMFEPFSQENRINTDQSIGTGLGLSIVKKIVELMGGQITVDSEVGKGTEFCVILRLPVIADRAKAKARKTDIASLSGKRLLLCEDNKLNAEIAQGLLKKIGCLVTIAENGRIGLETFAASPEGYFDAILMDIRMPEMDGLTAAESIRSLSRGDARTVPIIAMSANAFENDIRQSLEAGMNAHLAKPIDPTRLFETLMQMTGGKKDS